MSKHFSANQYEDAFRSNRLQNYEVSNKYREHPVSRRGTTQIIANNRGHIIEPLRRSTESPWGSYLGTWDMGRRVCKTKSLEKTKSASPAVSVAGSPEPVASPEPAESVKSAGSEKPEMMA